MEASPAGILRTLLLASGAGVVGFAIVVILGMDESSASQGAPLYIAVVAILLLGAVETQLRRLLSRDLPFTLGRRPEERRHDRYSLVLLALASVLLLGLALYRTVGLSPFFWRVTGYVLLLAAIPLLADRFRPLLKAAFDRGFDALFGADDQPTATRSFSFSVGSPPHGSVGQNAVAAPPRPALPPDDVQRYSEAWQRIRNGLQDDPAHAVRDAHGLLLELSQLSGVGYSIVRTGCTSTHVSAEAASLLALMGRRMLNVRVVQRTVAAALAHQPVTRAEAGATLDEYERLVLHVLQSAAEGPGWSGQPETR